MFGNSQTRHGLAIAVFAAMYGLLTLVVDNSYYQLIMTNVLVWAVLGLAWNLLSGYSGLISFGHAAFFGLGAYFVVLAHVSWGLSPWISIPIAGALGCLAGLLVGLPTFRLRGHYFALAMLAYPLALLYVFEWLGFQEVAIPMERESPLAFMQFDDRRIYVLLALAATVLVMLLTRKLERSRYGLSLLAIKQDETAAEAAGIDTLRWKLKAITLSGSIAATIGGFYAVVQLIVTPLSVFGVLVSAQALTVTMFGGVGTVWGPVIGAVSLVPLSAWLDAELADRLPGIQGVVYGIAIVAVILLAREGLFWKVRDFLVRQRQPGANGKTVLNGAHFPTDAGIRVSVTADRAPTDATVRTTAPTSDDVLLSVTGLSKAYGGLRAVADASLEIRRGEILGIIGPNGAGKTTLFNLLNGFTRPDAGQIEFESRPIVGMAPNRICRLGIGRTFQVVKPFNRMTIGDNAIVGAYVATESLAEARAQAARALQTVGLLESAGMIAGNATNEQLRLMELARALAGRPKLLLVDEVFAGLSATEVRSLATLIRRLADDGITIAIIEHTMRAMVKLVDRFVVLDHGAVLADGTPNEITRHPDVIEAYLGKKWLAHA